MSLCPSLPTFTPNVPPAKQGRGRWQSACNRLASLALQVRGGVSGGGKHVPGCAAEQTGQVAAEHLRGQTALLNPCCRDIAEMLQGSAATPSMEEQ